MNLNRTFLRFLATLSLTVAIGLPVSLFGVLEDTAVTPILADVLHVDHDSREILVLELEGAIETAEGDSISPMYRTFSVGEDVEAFDHVRAGDRVTLEVAASLAINLRKPTDEEVEIMYMSDTITQKDGKIEHVIAGVCKVITYDKLKRLVTLEGPRGRRFSVKVAESQAYAVPKGGAHIVVSYTQHEVVGMERAD